MTRFAPREWKQDNPTWKTRALSAGKAFPKGVWDVEPDKAQWVDEATGLDCLIVRNSNGALCGYVGVPPEHPWHGKNYNSCTAVVCLSKNCYEHSPEALTSVHGELTFSGDCDKSVTDPAHGICHVPYPGRPADVWWFGFDCAHAWDLIPLSGAYGFWDATDVYRTLGYVQSECTGLAKQLAAVVL